jgi:hypothetical protein
VHESKPAAQSMGRSGIAGARGRKRAAHLGKARGERRTGSTVALLPGGGAFQKWSLCPLPFASPPITPLYTEYALY